MDSRPDSRNTRFGEEKAATLRGSGLAPLSSMAINSAPRRALDGRGALASVATNGLMGSVFGCVANKGVTGRNPGSVAGKELSGLLLADG